MDKRGTSRFSSASCGIMIVKDDEELTIEYVNPAFCNILGYNPEEIQYKYANKMSVLMDKSSVKKVQQFVRMESENVNFVFEHEVKANKKKVWLLSYINTYNYDAEKVIYFVCHDITHYKVVEYQNKEIQQRLEYIYNQTDVEVLVYELSSEQVISAHGEKFFAHKNTQGSDVRNILLHNVNMLAEYREQLKECFDKIKDGEQKALCELRISTLEGQTKWVVVSFGVQGSKVKNGVMVFIKDVSTEKEAVTKYLNETMFYQAALDVYDAYGHIDVDQNKILRVGGVWNVYESLIDEKSFSQVVTAFIERVVHVEDKAQYKELVELDNLKESFKNGVKILSCEFRRILDQNKMNWMEITVQLFENPLNGHVMGLLCLKNIDILKKNQLRTLSEIGHYCDVGNDVREEKSDVEDELRKEAWQYAQEFNVFAGENGEIAYLVDPLNYELLCGNKAFYDRLGLLESQCYRKKCYELLHHRSAPCTFCGKSNWTKERYYMYRNYNKVLEQDFLIKNKLIEWKNQQILFAIAVDLSNDKSTVGFVESETTENHMIISGIQRMQSAENLQEMMESAFESIGEFFYAEHIQFWQKKEGKPNYECTFAWNKGEIDNKPYFTSVQDVSVVNLWIENRKWKEVFHADNQEVMLAGSFEMYERMNQYGIKNQHWMILYKEDNTLLGFLEINNMTINMQNTSFMQTFCSFLVSEWGKRRMLERILFAGFHDSLTGLLNRVQYELFVEELKEAEVSSLGVVCLNINGLKRVNDVHGFHVGNQYIKQLAVILQQVYGKKNVYRLSGDEFLIVCKDVTQKNIEMKMKEMDCLLEADGRFTVSAGYAWDNIETEIGPLVAYATHGMGMQKRLYYAECKDEKQEKLELLEGLMGTIEQGKMLTYLQPKVDVRQNKIVGAEALVRYVDEKGEIVPPAKFIPTLENNGLIRYVDLFIFEEVCKLLAKWQARGQECVKISVNFSRMTVTENNLISSMEAIVTKYHAPKEYIEIEITEGFADVGKALLNQSVNRIGKSGYRISLDDFGVKYTNLTILNDIEVNVLKLDRSLIYSLREEEKTFVILKHIVHMCEDLGIEVIAEGVETKEQELSLVSIGCYIMQGYFYGRPNTIDTFEQRLLE